MSKAKNFGLLVGLIGMGLLVGAGCPKPSPTPPDYLPFFIASPTSLDFGIDKNSLTLYISKNYTSQPLPTFTLSNGGATWFSISPATGNSSGPSNPAQFTVSLDRTKLAAGTSTGAVTVSAPGVSSLSVPVSATARISANFEATPLVTSLGQGVDFTDMSSVAPGESPINSWMWDFGDGTQSNLQDPQQHIYPSQGLYTVTLTVSNGILSDTEVKIGYISVEGPTPPTADFTASTQTPVVNTPVDFQDLSDPGSAGQVDTWFWEFGDGATSAAQNPSHTYTAVANYTVALTVTTVNGMDTLSRTNYIQVQPEPPDADFMADDTTPGVGVPVQFTDLSDPGSAPQINTWLWNFGDGGTSFAQNPTHTYTAIANYSVSLTVTAASGSNTETKPNYISVHAK